MLQKIRERFTGGIALVILGLIGASFVFVGVNYNFASGTYVAKVDGEEIPAGLFEQRYRQEIVANPELADATPAQRQQVRRQILDSMVREELLRSFLTENGYRVGDRQLTELLQQEPEFQTDGKFDQEKYLDYVQSRGRDPREFEESQRAALREFQVRSGILATAVVTPAEYRRYLNLAAEQRLVNLATLTQNVVNDEIEVTEEQIQAFYDSNPTLYQLSESVDIRYIRISRDDVAAAVDVSEEELAAYYEDNKSRYLQDEQRQARHILILFEDDEAAAQAQAEDILMQIRSGDAFEALAEEFSMDTLTASNGGDLGSLTQSQLPDALGDAIFNMSAGDLEGPVRSEFGFHIVRLDEIFERGPLPLDQVRGELLSELRDRDAESLYLELERKLSDALFDLNDIDEIAAAVGTEVGSIDGFTRDGAEPFGSNQAAIDAVFDPMLHSGERVSEVIDLDASSAAVFHVSQYNPAKRQPLEQVRPEVERVVRSQEAEVLLAARADQILDAVAAGEDFGAAAEAAGAIVGEPQLLSRQQTEVDQLVVFEVFAAPKPEQGAPIRDRVRGLDGSYTVYSLEAVMPGRPESIPLEQRDAGKAQLAQESGVGDYIAFLQALYNDADVVINEDALEEQQDLLQ
jgi:peptidyl-prolyl cis-trans isomerase D